MTKELKMKKLLAIVALVCSFGLWGLPLVSANVYADKINAGGTNLEYNPNYTDPSVDLPDTSSGNGEQKVKERAKTIVEVLSMLVGVVSVVMIIWGGIMYSYSAGDPGKAQLAKRIIVSAIIGLVLSILATVILNAVVTVSQGGTI